MVILGFSSKTLGPNIRILALPFISVVVLIFLFIFVIKFGYAQINGQLKGVKETTRIERILKEKASFLRQIKGSALEETGPSLTAHPHTNPSVWMVSHLRAFGQSFSLISKDLRLTFSQEGNNDINKAEINTKVESNDMSAILSFLSSFQEVAPISTINEVNLKQEKGKGVVSAEVKITVYWSNLPTKIPPITEPITALTENELKTLNFVSGLKPPAFTSLSPAFPIERLNPFN